MTHSTDIATLARWMAADFSNQAQAFENPPIFAHIRVCMRPLPLELLSGVSFLVEQAYDYMINDPYRLRVLKLITNGDRIEIENYTVKNEEQFYGASRDPKRLHNLKADQLEKLPGCNMIVEWTGHSFKGYVEPGKGCMVVRKGQNTYLDSTFEIDENRFISLDRGRDPETDEHIWGSVGGPFEFVRWGSFAEEVKV
ncbi:chromophore lyase CpcT/CpeT [Coleofasciculus sp. FACHB-64]|uniref:chromophore lyase CpcT/CpeT n=1 Tax=Cyanophyceae TaxID=3028117 RepID=UPI001688B4D2|nr:MULTISPECIES: chromophore lyase CpcT/CpeT [unclassified Coleofasciculus]MBD1837452.1 chromophore lyase CpcT/CpeT [Coleofasciculus sp. FACHB-501]MBD1880165.1 chromophore lyase CpcT/CpeT [Coleofasciculus sp. FACHB-T130]MBD1889021.1 chromophore lyase CpcT/CpeT [Coleofasciculus sp. FACHB-SPT9]MBD1894084.1 chromophore lyase CpcT/CpeT [Coleofasciculus sp. FACHB-129]MBD1900124.1 chromophore lyase CpcT/CpeT [Coleofasciculus sp. FACHB-125]